jgi:hypothetical protein
MLLEPGPLGQIDPARLAPMPGRPDFLAVVAPGVAAVDGAGGALELAKSTIAPIVTADLDGPFEQEIVPAIVGLEALDREADAADYAGMLSSGSAIGLSVDDAATNVPAPSQVPPDDVFGQTVQPEPPPPDDLAPSPFHPPDANNPPVSPIGPTPIGTPPGPAPVDEAHVRAVLIGLYYELLERPPDPDGLEFWVQRAINERLTDAQLRAFFLSSDEYQQKHGG